MTSGFRPRSVAERVDRRVGSQPQLADARAGEIAGRRRRQLARARDDDDGGEQPLLPASADLGQDDLAAVALDLRVAERHRVTR